MERELLLLGLLRQNEMHGYQINEFIDSHLGSGINLTRPTAYRMLHNMADRGWITFHEEKVGKRPTRRIYAITKEGEAKFHEILLTCLGEYQPAEYPSSVCIAFIDYLPVEVILPLLEKRLQAINEQISRLKADKNHPGAFQLTIDHQVKHLEVDFAFVSDLISWLESAGTNKKVIAEIHS